MPDRPVQEIRMNFCSASIWENPTEAGKVRFRIQLSKLFKGEDGWQRTQSFDPEDLPYVVKVADQAHTWIAEERARRARARQEEVEPEAVS